MNTFPLNRPISLDEFIKGYARGGEVESNEFSFDDSGFGDLAGRYGMSPQSSVSDEAEGRDTIMPTGEDEILPESYYDVASPKESSPASPLATAAQYDEKGNLLPSPDSPLTQMSGGVPRWAKMMELYGAVPSLIQNLTTAGTGGKDISVGDLYKQKREQAVKAYENKIQRFKDAGEWNETHDANLKADLDRTLNSLTQEETSYLNTLPQRQVLSDLLKENKFNEAYKYAQDNGMQTLLLQPDQLRNLRDPFTREEAQQFIRSMPYEFIKSAYGDRYEFEDAFKFDPEGAESRGALSWVAFGPDGRPQISEPGKAVMSETGYPSLDAVLKPQELKKKDGTFEKIFKAAAIVAAIYGGAQLVGALKTASAAKAIGATAAKTAGTAAAASAAPTAVAAAAPVAASTAALSPLQTITVLGSKAAGAGLTAGQVAGLAGGTAAASQLAGAGGGGAGAGAQPAAPEIPVEPPLEEVVVQTSPYELIGGYDPATLFASNALIQGTPDTAVDITGQPETQPDLTEGETEPDLTEGKIEATDVPADIPLDAEVLVYGSKPLPYLDLLTAGATIPALSNMLPEGSFGQPTTMQEPTQVAEETGDIADELAGTTAATEPTIMDRFKNLLDKYGTVENLLKVAGAVTGGTAGGQTPAAGGAAATYDPRLSAQGGQWIDWEKVKADAAAAGMDLNTYTARNWNKIQNRALEAGGARGVTTTAGPNAMVDPSSLPGAGNIMGGGAVAPNTPQGYNFPGGAAPDTAGSNFDLLKYLEEYQPQPMAYGGMSKGSKVRGPGHGREDLIPALLSDGEYVIDAETMALLGNGSTDAAAKKMDQFRENIRKHKGTKLAKGGISPDAKSPLQYLRGA